MLQSCLSVTQFFDEVSSGTAVHRRTTNGERESFSRESLDDGILAHFDIRHNNTNQENSFLSFSSRKEEGLYRLCRDKDFILPDFTRYQNQA